MSSNAPHHEPAIRAPWPTLVVAGVILASYGVQVMSGRPDEIARALGISSDDLRQGRAWGLITALFVHGGWMHAGLNAMGTLAFGSPVARRCGLRAGGPIIFFAFYLLCGAFANLGFVLVQPASDTVLIGASGAVAGLMGAASRMLGGPGRLASLTSPPVLGMAMGWLIVNLIIAIFGAGGFGAPGPIAWQAHLFGYVVGACLIGPIEAWRRHATDHG